MRNKLEKVREEIQEIDKQIESLSARRAKLTSVITVSGKTHYFRGTPRRLGLYHYSSLGCAPMGGAVGRWNGKTWEALPGWGDFTSRGEVVWYGGGKTRRQPINEPNL